MSDDTNKSMDAEGRRRRRRRRRGGRQDGPGGGSQAEGRPARGPRARGDEARDGERADPERASEGRAPDGKAPDGKARRRRRRRRREGDAGSMPASAGAPADSSASPDEQESPEARRERGGRSARGRRRRRSRAEAGEPRRPDDRPVDRLADPDPDDGRDHAPPGPPGHAARDGEDERFAAPWDERDEPGPDPGLSGAAHAGERADAAPGDPDTDAGAHDDAPRDMAPAAAEAAADEEPWLPAPEPVRYEEPPADDPDPVTWDLDQADDDGDERALDTPVYNTVGVKFSAPGRIYLYDAGDEVYARGETVVVETDRGARTGTVAVASQRKPHRRGDLKQVLRRANRNDLRAGERNQERSREALQVARDVARTLRLPIKVFRAEYAHTGKKALVYFTADERVDFRDMVRELSKHLRCRVEMRQTGVRDEARMVGGIGSCGRELCCTTWLPEFVPVSIKMAKDQGLVLNPTKVSGQCGRLKCCLVYEQETYASLRKGLPKLGKRVVTAEGEEGRVVEVDVLHQRVRVSLGPGEFRVLAADQVRPMFPSQQQKPRSGGRTS